MLALNINDPVTEQYFNHDPKEVSDLLKAIATSKATIIFNNTGQDIDRLKELQNLIDFNNTDRIVVSPDIDVAILANELNN